MSEKHQKIKELGLEKKIKRMFYVERKNSTQIAAEVGLPRQAIERWLRDDRIQNFTDNRIESIARSDDYNALSLITTFFDSAAYASKELAMTAIIGQILREEVASILAEQGIKGLLEDENEKLVTLWFKNAEKLSKLAVNVPKYLDSYINLYTEVLDVQRQVSYVRALTDALARVSPETHKLVIQELNKDIAAKAVMNSLEPQDIASYWGDKAKVLESGE